MSGWIFQWKPFWIPVGDSFLNAYIEEWFYAGSDAPANPAEMKQWVTKLERPDVAPPAPDLQDPASPWENVEAPLPPSSPRGQVTFTHPLPTCSAPERLKLPFPLVIFFRVTKTMPLQAMTFPPRGQGLNLRPSWHYTWSLPTKLLQNIARHQRGNLALPLWYIMRTDVQPAVRLDKGVSASTTGTQVLDVGMKTLV